MAKCWNTFDLNGWNNFSEADWHDLNDICDQSPVGVTSIVSGSFAIKDTFYTNEGIYDINARIEPYEDFFFTSDTLVLGGIPLTLLKNDIGQCVLPVIVDNLAEAINNSTESIKKELIWFGKPFRLYKLNNCYVPFWNVVNGVEDHAQQELRWNGVSMPIDIDGNLVITQYEPLTDADAESELMFNGCPLLIRRYDYNWYLVIATN